jgi:hypothetical protein
MLRGDAADLGERESHADASSGASVPTCIE